MSLLSKVGRRSFPVVSFLSISYLLLSLGALSMIIPFMIMLTGAVSNSWDFEHYHVVPNYLWRPHARYLKFVAEKYSGSTEFPRDFRLFSAAYRPEPRWRGFRAMREDPVLRTDPRPLAYSTNTDRREACLRIYRDYVQWVASFDQPLMTLSMFERFTQVRFQRALQSLYENRLAESLPADVFESLPAAERREQALALLNATWQEARFTSFFFITMGGPEHYPYHLRVWLPPLNEQRVQDYKAFVRDLPSDWKIPITAQHLWVRFLDANAGNLQAFNDATGLALRSYHDLPFPEAPPQNARLRELWDAFTGTYWPLWMIELPSAYAERWHAFLRRRADSRIDRLNDLLESDYADFESVPFTGSTPVRGLERNMWRDFLLGIPPAERALHRVYPEQSYRAFLQARYEDIEALNRAYGWNAGNFGTLEIPLAEVDFGQFLLQDRRWTREFLTFNFRRVFEFMAIQGRAAFNTIILVALSLLSTLTINPLAAYALSRFNLRHTQKILLFLLATMAFPAEVSMIPNFLLLRELGLLNTFGALVLPGLANGFGIFLLKGFFDSLPRELYEAATIDGAGEGVMFLNVTLPLCKPILAYQALLSFIAAYSGFMWAFIVCQDPRMWTLMVWIYQYQQTAAQYPFMVMAAFVLASIPTLLVFVFCQKIILRGIIIPTMK